MKPIREERYELKFVFQQSQKYYMYDWIRTTPCYFVSQYHERNISSVYFDTEDDASVGECVSDAVRKVKVRLRWYDNEIKKCFLEVKSKNGLICEKQRFEVSHLATDDLETTLQNIRSISPSEFPLACYLNKPVVLVRYRRAYFAAANLNYPELRTTVDSELSFKEMICSRALGSFRPISDDYILEVKFPVKEYAMVAPLFRGINNELAKSSKFYNSMIQVKNISF